MSSQAGEPGSSESAEARWKLLQLPTLRDSRGVLMPVDFTALPFMPTRMFTVTGVPAGGMRGQHAHARGQQFLLCLSGRVVVEIREGRQLIPLELTAPDAALLIGPGVWARQRYDGPDTVLLVLASHPYDPASYIYDVESGFDEATS
jgi:dTDP-4-dehydrorhamnose 3,5-epimerase-like enzyme